MTHQWWQPRGFPWAGGNINNKPQDAENEHSWDEDMAGLALTIADCAPARLAARVQSEPWSVSGPGCFEGFPVWPCVGSEARAADFVFRGELRCLQCQEMQIFLVHTCFRKDCSEV